MSLLAGRLRPPRIPPVTPSTARRRAGLFRFRSLTWPTTSPISRACSTSAHPTTPRALDLYNRLSEEGVSEKPPSEGFLLSIQPEHGGTSLWMRDDVTGDPERLIQFVKLCAGEFGLHGRWGFQYATTCSRPRIDAFGGGAHVLDLATGDTVAWIYTNGWLADLLSSAGDRT